MAWGSKTASTQLTGITTTEQFFSQTPTLNPGESCEVEIIANPPATPTDDLEVRFYATLDAATEDWDDTPFMGPLVISKSIDPNKRSFTVTDKFKFRVGVKVSGATDTYVADMNHKLNGVNL